MTAMTPARAIALACLTLISVHLTPAWSQADDPASLWADFSHYVLVARPDLAADAGTVLLSKVQPQELLDIVEASDYREQAGRILDRATGNENSSSVASKIVAALEQARIERARDAERIAADIKTLSKGQRPYRNAVARLRAAGQYAVPQMVEALRDPQRKTEHPFILNALKAMGRSVVAPLSQALPELEPVPMSQVAQVLGDVGYPEALPYIKKSLETPGVDADVQLALTNAYKRLLAAARQMPDAPASELFVLLGETQYSRANRVDQISGFDAATNHGIVWAFTEKTGLVPIAVPAEIFADVLAMEAAESALKLDATSDEALSLYIRANLRRENNLPEGQVDPSYGSDRQPAMFYAMLAGPNRLHEVLARALDDGDPQLALDAIAGLQATSGTEKLVNSDGPRQPLLRALSFPDRRVRFHSAVALAQTRPNEAFPGSERVTPVLAEAARQTGGQTAVVLAAEREDVNQLQAAVRDLDMSVIAGTSLASVSDLVRARAGVDLIIVSGSGDAVRAVYNATAGDYMLAGAPILALTGAIDAEQLSIQFAESNRLTVSAQAAESAELATLVKDALTKFSGSTIDQAESTELALTALELLRTVAVESPVFDVTDALPTLVSALGDDRPTVVAAAGKVLARIGMKQAQQPLAKAALDTEGDLQVSLLTSLGESATSFGNMTTDAQSEALLKLVDSSEGETALAAAKAHGALALPTSSAVKLIAK